MASSIPCDLIWDILSHLAVKDLLRFKCVSKFLESLIDSQDFIKQHNSQIYGIFECVEFENPKFMLLDLDSRYGNHIPQDVLNPPAIRDGENIKWRIVGSCDGLVALRNEDAKKEITLWNPFTRKYKKIDSSPNYTDRSTIIYGIGYDPNTNDFKLVEVSLNLLTFSASIYSLKTNSWEKKCVNRSLNSIFKILNNDYSLTFGPGSVLVNNALHFALYNANYHKGVIAFDLVKEDFYQVPVLGSLINISSAKLGVLDDCLTITSTQGDQTHVCIMKEYGVENSWIKLLSLSHSESPYIRNMIPLRYSKGRDKVLLSSYGQFLWYDLVNNVVEPSWSVGMAVLYRGYVNIFKGSLAAFNRSADKIVLKRKQVVSKHGKEKEDCNCKRNKGKQVEI